MLMSLVYGRTLFSHKNLCTNPIRTQILVGELNPPRPCRLDQDQTATPGLIPTPPCGERDHPDSHCSVLSSLARVQARGLVREVNANSRDGKSPDSFHSCHSWFQLLPRRCPQMRFASTDGR